MCGCERGATVRFRATGNARIGLVKKPSLGTRRVYSVVHGCDGFTLWVRDHSAWRWWSAELAYRLVGPLDRGGRFTTLPWRAVNAIFKWQDKGKVVVANVHLTAAEAVAINPRYLDDDVLIAPIDGVDEDGNVYRDGALVGACCEGCGEVIDTNGRWWAKVMEDHAPHCGVA